MFVYVVLGCLSQDNKELKNLNINKPNNPLKIKHIFKHNSQ